MRIGIGIDTGGTYTDAVACDFEERKVLAKGKFEIKTKYQPNVVYRLVYLSCTQYRQFMQEMAVFSLKVSEPDPTDREIIE